MYGWELRERRRAAGLTADRVAVAIGTSPTNVAAYERGAKKPSATTLGRLVAACATGAGSPIFVNRLMTVPGLAAALRRGLRSGWPTRDLLRLVRESRANARWVEQAQDLALFLAQPSTTGDRRWDALLAGSTEQLALARGLPAPPWVAGHSLAPFWFVSANPAFDAYVFAHSPPSLKVRGVLVDPADLDSV